MRPVSRGFYSSLSTPKPLSLTNTIRIVDVQSISLGIRATVPKMTKREEGEDNESRNIQSNPNPHVKKLQQLIQSSPGSGGWEKSWEQGVTPWDLGQPTPIVAHLHQSGALPKGRALVPGCGAGYDVVAMASPERHVVGLDISDTALNKAKELSSSSPNANYFAFLKADFFTWRPTELFDLIFDYTFFCAIEPDLRPAWAEKIGDLLKPDGELITLIFPISDHVGGPPYKVSVSDYEEVLHPLGFQATSIVDNELAIRAGRIWKREARKVEEIYKTFLALIIIMGLDIAIILF